MDPRMGSNINGPSVIKVPDWMPNPLGAFYLYFAAHHGRYIRMAFADSPTGPWHTYAPGVLAIRVTGFRKHIASPDVIVDEERRQLRMYFHGRTGRQRQATRLALSTNGIAFEVLPDLLGPAYFRVFRWAGYWYSLAMPGELWRSPDGLSRFERGPTLFSKAMRHSAVFVSHQTLHVVYSRAWDEPERLVWSCVALAGDWRRWTASRARLLLTPERRYEGAGLPIARSKRGIVTERVRQLRDPAVLETKGERYLLYAVAGEHGIAIARLDGLGCVAGSGARGPRTHNSRVRH
jgi:hypothetical protein